MKNKKYTVSDECIACRTSVEVAETFFEINDANIAYLKKQPENAKENKICLKACLNVLSNQKKNKNLKVLKLTGKKALKDIFTIMTA